MWDTVYYLRIWLIQFVHLLICRNIKLEIPSRLIHVLLYNQFTIINIQLKSCNNLKSLFDSVPSAVRSIQFSLKKNPSATIVLTTGRFGRAQAPSELELCVSFLAGTTSKLCSSVD